MPKIDFAGKSRSANVQNAAGKIFDTEAGYLCEKSQSDTSRAGSKSARIPEQPIEPAQAQKILANGKSDLPDNSSQNPASRFPLLVMDEKGKITFDFPERE